MQELEHGEDGLRIVWGSSDAFKSNQTLLSKLRTTKRQYYHVYDPLHTLKNLRNLLLNKDLCLDDVFFNMHTINNLRNSEDPVVRKKYRQLLPESPFPSDTMNLSAVHDLLKNKLIETLKKEESLPCQALATYLNNMKIFYSACTENHISLAERKNRLSQVADFFGRMKNLGTLGDQVRMTSKSLEEIEKLCLQHGYSPFPSFLLFRNSYVNY